MEIHNQIIQKLCDNGHQAYLTGGAIRDEFIGVNANDYDIVTGATPDELFNLFKNHKVNLVGASFAVTIIDGIDVATYRIDKNNGNDRHNCSPIIAKTIQEDLARRDFTMNAIACCPYTGELIDPHDGMLDLKNKVIRFVGNPDERIREDYLRMIRAARFVTLVNGRLENSAKESIRKLAFLVKNIPKERISTEILKVLKYEKPSIFFETLNDTGLLPWLIPDMVSCVGFNGGNYHKETVFEHLMIAGDSISARKPLLRLAGYLHDIGKPESYDNIEGSFIGHEIYSASSAYLLLNKYRFSHEIRDYVCAVIGLHMHDINSESSAKSVRKLIKRCHDKGITWKDWLQLRIADRKANLAKENLTRSEIKAIALKFHHAFKQKDAAFSVKDLNINGNDIISIMGFTGGCKEVGDSLNRLFIAVEEGFIENNFESLVNYLKGGIWLQSSKN